MLRSKEHQDDRERRKKYAFAEKSFQPLYFVRSVPEDRSKIEMSFDLTVYQPQVGYWLGELVINSYTCSLTASLLMGLMEIQQLKLKRLREVSLIVNRHYHGEVVQLPHVRLQKMVKTVRSDNLHLRLNAMSSRPSF